MKIITLIASHIDSNKRLHNFIKLLAIINNQIDYFDDIDLRVSLSHDENISREEISFLFNNVNKNGFKLHYQDNLLSQFEHYKFLNSTLNDADNENTWILFSDDDDEWAENRLAAYHHMINYIKENEYPNTSSICYTNETDLVAKSQVERVERSDKSASTYIGSYVDYCVKLKYLRIFFDHATNAQLKHKFCDCYFVKFICSYGQGTLKRAFCATPDLLYYWIKHSETDPDYSKNKPLLPLKDLLANNLDLYIAQYSKQNVKDWLRFCDIYLEHKITNGQISDEIKRYLIKLYLDTYEKHIFSNKTALKLVSS